jgi:XTP/dITP diphosphohydrolase
VTPRLVLATHNAHKVAELYDILSGLLEEDVELLDAGRAGLPDVEETGTTFAENALLKARAGVAASGLPCVGDDSGLVVDALDGAPGVYSARFAAREGSPAPAPGRAAADAANLRLLLERMADVPDDRRTARFVCAAALALPDGRTEVVEAAVEGRIIRDPRGEGGFGYDPVFVPEGGDRTLAEIPAADKHAISHRGRALRALGPVLRDRLRA